MKVTPVNAVAAVLIVVVVTLQLYSPPQPEPRANPEAVFDVVPSSLEGWQVEDRSLGATETVNDAAERILNLDTFINRNYRKGRTEFTVYAAYWGANRMPVQLVSSHTPDRCWTTNGWECTKMRFNEEFSVAGQALFPAQYREFYINGALRYVYYWHLIGDRYYDYGERNNAVPDALDWVESAVDQFAEGTGEQFFIRVDSSTPFEELRRMPGFITVMKALADLGLEAPES